MSLQQHAIQQFEVGQSVEGLREDEYAENDQQHAECSIDIDCPLSIAIDDVCCLRSEKPDYQEW